MLGCQVSRACKERFHEFVGVYLLVTHQFSAPHQYYDFLCPFDVEKFVEFHVIEGSRDSCQNLILLRHREPSHDVADSMTVMNHLWALMRTFPFYLVVSIFDHCCIPIFKDHYQLANPHARWERVCDIYLHA